MREHLDFFYDGAGWLVALFMVGTLALVLSNVLGRMFNFNPSGSDAYAGYRVAAASFLTLAHKLKRGEHIPVTLIRQHLGVKANLTPETACYEAAVFTATSLAWFLVSQVGYSSMFYDFSQSTDATALWISWLGMGLVATRLPIGSANELVVQIFGRPSRHIQHASQSARMA